MTAVLLPALFATLWIGAANAASPRPQIGSPRASESGPARPAARRDRFQPSEVVEYKRTPQGALHLHVFRPARPAAATPRAAILFFFGGGWRGGRPQQFFEQARALADRGMVAISAEYRVKTRHGTSPFECVEDGKSAVRWVREHAHELGVDPDRIVAAGGSAGGHVAACTGLVDGFEAEGDDLTISSRPNAMVLCNPVLDTTARGFEIGPVRRAERARISPTQCVRGGVAPTLVLHGSADRTVPLRFAQAFAAAMAAHDNPCRLAIFDGGGHGFFNSPSFRPRAPDDRAYRWSMRECVRFLTRYGFLPTEPRRPSNRSTASGSARPSGDARSRPNIVVIYTDDQGYGDVRALNPDAKFETPHLDRIAAEGVAFTNAHSADSVCTPSRYALLTGRYAWRTRRKRGVLGAEAPCLIADGRMTLASMLRATGYRTAIVGKWHLGMDFPGKRGARDWSMRIEDMPLDKGFDYFFGIPASLNFGVLAWFEGRYAAVPPTRWTRKKPNTRHVDYRIMPPYAESLESLAQSTGRRGGFEVAPDFVDNECLTRFTDRAVDWLLGRAGGEAGEQPFFLYLALTSPHYPVCPLPEYHGRGAAGAYGEFVIETDHHVGRILRTLEEAGLDQDTLVLVTSDNGPEKSWDGRLAEFDHDSRGGFRGGKRSVYEGGHRVPFLVRWPNGIREPGRRFDGLVGQVDLLATLAEVVGAELPEDAGEDSESFASVLSDPESSHRRQPLVNHGNGRGTRYAITEGRYKLVLPSPTQPAELYDLATDRTESRNVAADHPDIVAALTGKMNAIVRNGRSTPGSPQPNDTGYWPGLTWMNEADYR